MGEEEINQGGNSSNLIPSQVKPSKRSNQQRRRRPKNKQTNHEDAPNKNENPKSQNNGGDDDTKKAENIGPNTKPKAGKGSDDEKKRRMESKQRGTTIIRSLTNANGFLGEKRSQRVQLIPFHSIL